MRLGDGLGPGSVGVRAREVPVLPPERGQLRELLSHDGMLGALRSAGIRAEGLYRLQALKRAEMLPPLRHALEEESTRAAHGEFDTHPPDAERIERVRGIEGTVPDDPAPAVSLLAGAEKMAAELAAEVLQQLPPPDESQPAPAGSVDEVR